MEIVVDFHVHSKYSRATSKDMDVEHLSSTAKIKGINVVGTGDFTHPQWLLELKNNLSEVSAGIYERNGTHFILTAEVNNIFTKAQKSRRVHNILIAPSFKIVAEINKALSEYGDLFADGRPILKLDAKKMLKMLRSISHDIYLIPAHLWTPWFGLLGSATGFDSVEECFEEETENIYAVETGLSSDPAMNWRLSKLDKFALISNSDAHSPKNLGREANIFDCEIDYYQIMDIIKKRNNKQFLYTIEFFPQEGKYHYDGHRLCGQCFEPRQTIANNFICPVCKKKITVGVMHRVEELSDREQGFENKNSVPFKNIIPLREIIAEVKKVGPDTKTVQQEYNHIVTQAGSEFEALLKKSEKELKTFCNNKVAQGIIRVRNAQVNIHPGFDGEYGKIEIFKENEANENKQFTLF
jgi:uncharacterized protein (TIGR00375 family)